MNILGVIIGFAIIIILNYKRINLGYAILIGAVIGGMITGINFFEILNILIKTLQEYTTIRLAVIMILISGLGFILDKNNDFNNLVNSLFKIFNSNKPLIVLFPSIIATLSVPGGAILSAPMVDKSGDNIDLSLVNKTASNLFYRHIFFLVYPLYPSLIVTADLFDVSEFYIIKYNIIIMSVGLLVSYFLFFYNKEKSTTAKNNKKNIDLSNELKNVLLSLGSIIIILVLSLIFNIEFMLSLFIGTLWSFFRYFNKEGYSDKIIYQYITKGVNYKLVIIIISVMFFKNIIEISGLPNMIGDILNEATFSLIVVIPVLGFVTSFFLGSNMGSLGILAPIFIPIFPANNAGPYITLLFISAYIGYNLSPIHLCLVLTKEYFNTGYIEIYNRLIMPFSLMLLTAIFQFLYLN